MIDPSGAEGRRGTGWISCDGEERRRVALRPLDLDRDLAALRRDSLNSPHKAHLTMSTAIIAAGNYEHNREKSIMDQSAFVVRLNRA